jgi:hypothetical protein
VKLITATRLSASATLLHIQQAADAGVGRIFPSELSMQYRLGPQALERNRYSQQRQLSRRYFTSK